MKRFLIIIFSCFACFLLVQKSLAKQQYPDLASIETLAAYDELDKLLRIFDFGKIETHLKGLDRSNPASVTEVYLILAYHKTKLSVSNKPNHYAEIGVSLATSEPNFDQNPFFQTYEAILFYLDFKYDNSKESHLASFVRISNMNARSKIQKYVKCSVIVDGLMRGYAKENVDIVSLSAEDCSKNEGLQYLSYLAAALHANNGQKSFEKRMFYYENLKTIIYENSTDPHAKLEIALALVAGPMSIEQNELSLELAFVLKKLIVEYELENTHLHFLTLFLQAGIVGLWGDNPGYQQFIKEAESILGHSENPRSFLDGLSNELLNLPLSYGVATELTLDIFMERWKDFERNYKGDMTKLDRWQDAILPISQHLFKPENNQSIKVLKTFIDLHDQGPAKAKPYIISSEYSEDLIKIFKQLNRYLASESVEKNEIGIESSPYIFKIHLELAKQLSYTKNEKLSDHQFELAWSRMPENLKSNSLKSVEILGHLLGVYSRQKKYQEQQQTAYRILDIVERSIFSSKGPFSVQQFEGPRSVRFEVTMAMYALAFESLRIEKENPEGAQIAISEVFRGLQIVRANRLTKLYKTEQRETALNDISDLKKYANLAKSLKNKSGLEPIDKIEDLLELDRGYKFSNLKDIQSKIPLDTVIIAAFDDTLNTNFSVISSYRFNPFHSSVKMDELSYHMDLVINSAQIRNQTVEFDYDSAHWIYSKMFTPESDPTFLEKGIKNIIFLPSKTMFNFPMSLLHNGQTRLSDNSVTKNQYDPRGFLIDNYYLSYDLDFSDEMVHGSELQMTAEYAAVKSSTFFGVADPYLGDDKDAKMRGIKYVDIDQLDFKNLSFESLPETLDEVNAAAQYFEQDNVTIMSGDTATKKNILASPLQEYDVLMFSTHGISPGVVAGFQGSGLLLSLPETSSKELAIDDVLLTPEDVLGLNLNADIIILNACNSGLSDVANAPGLTGLAQSFLAAGSDAVMVSHWPISSATTVKITKRIFETIKQYPKTSFNRALTDAQLSIKADPKTQHPFYWAPYNIYGNF